MRIYDEILCLIIWFNWELQHLRKKVTRIVKKS